MDGLVAPPEADTAVVMTPPLDTTDAIPTYIRLSVIDCLLDGIPRDDIKQKLWREDPAVVGALIDRMSSTRATERSGKPHGRLADLMRELHRPLPTRDRKGLPLGEMADQSGIPQEALATLLEHQGYLEMVPFGGRQSRCLVTDTAFRAGVGHNVTKHGIKGATITFPVFYPEDVPSLLWTLDWDGIQEKAKAIPSKRGRLGWLLDDHGYLPTTTIADIVGCIPRTVRVARETRPSSTVEAVQKEPYHDMRDYARKLLAERAGALSNIK